MKTMESSKGPFFEALVTVKELAQHLGVSSNWVYRHMANLPHSRVGKFYKFTPSDIEEWKRRSR
jgi:excisionase family DNA binding protein